MRVLVPVLVPEGQFTYECSNGHEVSGPEPLSKCLSPKCKGSLVRFGRGSRGSYGKKAK